MTEENLDDLTLEEIIDGAAMEDPDDPYAKALMLRTRAAGFEKLSEYLAHLCNQA